MVNKFEARTQKKQTAIIAASIQLFGKYGYKKTNIKMIAQEANVSQVSIYNYFENKENLVLACVKFLMQDILDKSKVILSEPISFEEKLNKVMQLCNGDFNAIIQEHFSSTLNDDSGFLQLLVETSSVYKSEIYKLYIQAGKDEGWINKDLATESILEFINAMNAAGATYTGDNSEQLFSDFQQILFYGIHKV
ncbi:TetR/AcrR family transcriptional regulator [Culicoidibacter larvae]|uniref:TetR/AcrR family transcriptional regulator n=1 Tax=Culicoidibacter larvae TaxID=2579976 RepID=A0A5R8QG68_9FIRM|nr:TetR/AcrR family transcriptional regulator [Culicoidibacter larvae]TLG76766.1 TetR/AcrR family transcriptional regulator [Culicoidibacter larvae]